MQEADTVETPMLHTADAGADTQPMNLPPAEPVYATATAIPGVTPDPVTLPGMPPWLVALLRGVGTAALAGGITFFAEYSHTSDPKALLLAVGPVVLTVIAARFGLEGVADSARADRAAAAKRR